MSIGDVIRHFEAREELPVEVDEVIEEILKISEFDHIFWFPVDINPEIIRGFIQTWDYPDDWTYTEDPSGTKIVKCVDIYYSSNDPDSWQRLVCCKEAVHIVDWDLSLVSSPGSVDELIEKIILPPELQDPSSDGVAVNRDRAAELQACALLLPMAARNLLMAKVAEKTMTVDDVARLADIPVRYVRPIMGPVWDTVYPNLVK